MRPHSNDPSLGCTVHDPEQLSFFVQVIFGKGHTITAALERTDESCVDYVCYNGGTQADNDDCDENWSDCATYGYDPVPLLEVEGPSDSREVSNTYCSEYACLEYEYSYTSFSYVCSTYDYGTCNAYVTYDTTEWYYTGGVDLSLIGINFVGDSSDEHDTTFGTVKNNNHITTRRCSWTNFKLNPSTTLQGMRPLIWYFDKDHGYNPDANGVRNGTAYSMTSTYTSVGDTFQGNEDTAGLDDGDGALITFNGAQLTMNSSRFIANVVPDGAIFLVGRQFFSTRADIFNTTFHGTQGTDGGAAVRVRYDAWSYNGATYDDVLPTVFNRPAPRSSVVVTPNTWDDSSLQVFLQKCIFDSNTISAEDGSVYYVATSVASVTPLLTTSGNIFDDNGEVGYKIIEHTPRTDFDSDTDDSNWKSPSDTDQFSGCPAGYNRGTDTRCSKCKTANPEKACPNSVHKYRTLNRKDDNNCFHGDRIGQNCENCKTGLFSMAGECLECPSEGGMMAIGIICYLLLICGILSLAGNGGGSFATWGTVISICVTHFQVMGVIIFSLGPVLNLPNVVIEFGRIFDLVFTLEFLKYLASPECFATDGNKGAEVS